MAKLKLGKLPDRNTVKVTFTASTQLMELLEEYAGLYERTYGTREKTGDLIPFMLETFVTEDVGFRKAMKEQRLKKDSQMMRDNNLQHNG